MKNSIIITPRLQSVINKVKNLCKERSKFLDRYTFFKVEADNLEESTNPKDKQSLAHVVEIRTRHADSLYYTETQIQFLKNKFKFLFPIG